MEFVASEGTPEVQKLLINGRDGGWGRRMRLGEVST